MKKLMLNKTKNDKKYSFDRSKNKYDYLYEIIATRGYLEAKNSQNIDELIGYIQECEFTIEIDSNGLIDLIDDQNDYGYIRFSGFKDIYEVCKCLEERDYFYDYFNVKV